MAWTCSIDGKECTEFVVGKPSKSDRLANKENNIKMDLREIGFEVVNWIELNSGSGLMMGFAMLIYSTQIVLFPTLLFSRCFVKMIFTVMYACVCINSQVLCIIFHKVCC